MQNNLKKYLTGILLVVSIALMPISGLAAPLSIPEHGIVINGAEKQSYIKDQLSIMDKDIKQDFNDVDGWKWDSFDIGNVNVERMQAVDKESNRVVLQLHGGGYVLGMSNRHRLLGLKQAALTKASEVYYVNYRLVPEYVYPAALEDAVTVYQGLLARGIKAQDIIVVGDSAGGNLALALSLYLKEHDIAQPAVLILESPWANLEHKEGTSRYTNDDKDQTLGKGTLLNGAVKNPVYAGKMALNDPRLSPIYADLTGLPPMLIQAGGNEIFLTECQELAAKAAEDGVDVTLTVYPGQPHDFALLFPEMNDSVVSLQEIRDFVERYM